MLLQPGLLLLLVLGLPTPAGTDDAEFFETRVRPLLAERCHDCHGAERQRSALRLDSVAHMLAGGSRGPAVVPGDADASLIVRAVRGEEPEYEMPPSDKLSAEEIAVLVTWIESGAKGPEETVEVAEGFDLWKRVQEHWGFRPIEKPTSPRVDNAPWSEHPVDAFLARALERADLAPNTEAPRRTLLRRASFDLIGLPPTPEELAAFEADTEPGAYARQLDRLLASPHFGERWGRHWLDLVRYAETKGHEFDYLIANAWQYRDYVIRAFNQDVPYDRFVREHIAGDLLPEPRPNPEGGWDESILGTGYWFFGEEKHSPVDIRADQTERIANQLDVFGKTFLGLTVACARCHDHKFEAISTRDYYALSGYLLSASLRQVRFETRENNARVAEALTRLARSHEESIVEATGKSLGAALEGTARAMLAARELELELFEEPQKEALAETWPAEWTVGVERIAARSGIEPARLEAWLHAVVAARGDPESPLSPWTELRGVSSMLSRELAEAGKTSAEPTLLFDFTDGDASEWIQDGFGFAPVEAGDVRLGAGPRNPLARLFSHPGAASDPTWNRLELAPGTERHPGLIDWDAAGRLLRTRTFRLESGSLYYLVDGAGHVFCEVDGHRMIAGPLHNHTVLHFKDEGRRWVRHDLGDYVGHVVHLEFSPAGDERGLVIERVVASAEAPPPLEPESDWLIHALSGVDGADPQAIATAYEELFRHAAAALERGELTGEETAPGFALVGWLLEHPELLAFPVETPELRETMLPYLEGRVTELARLELASATAPVLLDANGFDEHLLRRGDSKKPGPSVPRDFLEALGSARSEGDAKSSGRLALAQRLSDPRANPFLARVWANRIWQHVFGRGLVPTVDNLGLSGEPPSHPELLDHLSATLVEEGFSTKAILKHVLLSRAYRQSSRPSAEGLARDPDNRLLHHHPLQRLDAEVIRDSMLAVAGTLNTEAQGPPVPIHLSSFLQGRGRPASGPLDGHGRRSIYLAVRRNFLVPLFQVFDYPTPFTTRGRRTRSNVPAQALALWNDPFVIDQAARWAGAVHGRHESDAERIEELYDVAFNRAPSPEELETALGFLDEAGSEDTARLAELCHVLFNTKEFLYVD